MANIKLNTLNLGNILVDSTSLIKTIQKDGYKVWETYLPAIKFKKEGNTYSFVRTVDLRIANSYRDPSGNASFTYEVYRINKGNSYSKSYKITDTRNLPLTNDEATIEYEYLIWIQYSCRTGDGSSPPVTYSINGGEYTFGGGGTSRDPVTVSEWISLDFSSTIAIYIDFYNR